MAIALIGKNSFLGRALLNDFASRDWTSFSHHDALHADLKGFQCIVNCAFDPALKTGPYDPAHDIDLKIVQKIQAANTHYVMLSSRLVYGPRGQVDMILHENDVPHPENFYARAKYETEKSLVALLGQARVTILRIGNIFGAEEGRSTFMGRALQNLKQKGEIVFDMPGDAIRDFRGASSWAMAMGIIAQNPKGGIYNLGAGFGTEAQEIAQTLINAHGSGNLVIRPEKPADSFVLDMNKTSADYDIPAYTRTQLLSDLRALLDGRLADIG